MKAVIMAGGEGARLRPLTINCPKPMIPLVNKPVIAHTIDLLKRYGITDIIMTIQYLADNIQDYFGDGSEFGVNIRYSVEDVPLGTAGSVRKAAGWLDDTFLVTSGDGITDINLQKVIEFHQQARAVATITLAHVSNPHDYGMIITDSDGRVLQFMEKPGWSDLFSDTVNAGIYVLEPEVFDLYEADQVFDFSRDLFPLLMDQEEPLYGYVAEGYWTDIGSLDEYMRATADILRGRVQVDAIGLNLGGDIWAAGNCEIAPDAQLYGPIFLGEGVKIKGGVVIHGPAAIQRDTVIDNRANLERAIIWRNCYIGERAEVRGAIIGRQCSIKSKATIFEGAVIGDNTMVHENVVIQPNVKIWPDKEVEAGATVTTSIIWGSQGKRRLFGRYGVTGMVNVDLMPEIAAKLGAAYGASLPAGSSVALNREAHNTPRIFKRAILSGLPSAGVNVMALSTQPIPVARFYTRLSDAAGGVHVRLSPYDNRVIDIKFFDQSGLDLPVRSQRNVEHVFFRGDIRRVYLDEIGRIRYPGDVISSYVITFLSRLNTRAIREVTAGKTIVIDYANATTSTILPQILNELGCDVIAVNAEVDESKLFRTREQFEQGMQRLAAITGAVQASFGVRMDVGGEQAYFTLPDGQRLSGLDTLAVMAALALEVYPGKGIALPLTAPNLFDRIAEERGGWVRRVKMTPQSYMETALDQDIVLVGDGDGSFIFPEFTPFADSMFAVTKLLELMALTQKTVSDVMATLPSHHLAHVRVPCRWDAKGRVMRLLNERYRDHLLQQADGVKVDLGSEWVLILPDPDEPYFHVHAEGVSDAGAEELVQKYASMLNGLLLEM